MDDLQLLGVHEDGEHLLLATADKQRRFRLPLNDALRAAVRWEQSSRGGRSSLPDGQELRPRDVQAMIRAGATAQEAAERANWTVDKVRRYEGPILAERAYIASEAGRAHVRSRTGTVTLAERVAERLDVRGVSADSVTWDSWRDEDGHWTVEARFAAGGRQRTASWHFAKASMTVTAQDDEARWLSEEDGGPEPTVQHVVPGPSRVYDVEAEGGLRQASPATSPDEVTLMTSMRERSTARRRRGQRKSPAASPTALPALGDGAPVDAPPLAELRYDPQTMPPPPAAHGEPDADGIDGRPEPAVQADKTLHEGVLAGFDDDEPETLATESLTAVAEPVADEQPVTEPDSAEEVTPDPLIPEPEEPELTAPTENEDKAAETEPEAEPETEPEVPTEAEAEPAPVEPPPAEPPPAEPTPAQPPAAKPKPVPAPDTTPQPQGEAAQGETASAKPRQGQRAQPSRSSRSRRKGRASVPAWDDIVFGAKPPTQN